MGRLLDTTAARLADTADEDEDLYQFLELHTRRRQGRPAAAPPPVTAGPSPQTAVVGNLRARLTRALRERSRIRGRTEDPQRPPSFAGAEPDEPLASTARMASRVFVSSVASVAPDHTVREQNSGGGRIAMRAGSCGCEWPLPPGTSGKVRRAELTLAVRESPR